MHCVNAVVLKGMRRKGIGFPQAMGCPLRVNTTTHSGEKLSAWDSLAEPSADWGLQILSSNPKRHNNWEVSVVCFCRTIGFSVLGPSFGVDWISDVSPLPGYCLQPVSQRVRRSLRGERTLRSLLTAPPRMS